uniref:VWFA domain-containing protein n=1 Tax=Panagrellus redivivus TaxID=6233 RepID=A0A7E4UNJ7_PANRE
MNAGFWPILAITAVIAATVVSSDAARLDNSAHRCDSTPLQVIFLFDLSPDNKTDFTKQQERVIETINHIDTLTQNRSTSFGFVVFHRMPVLLSPLNSPKSGDSSKVTEQVQSVRPRRHAETSPAKALDLAAEQIEKNGRAGAQSLVFLVHDGLNNDLIAETLEAVDRLRGHNVSVFAVSGSPSPNLLGLAGYTKQRERIYSSSNDRITYLSALDKVLEACTPTKSGKPDEIVALLANTLKDVASKDNETAVAADATEKKVILSPNPVVLSNIDSIPCPENSKIDVMIVLDTSGSVFNAFAEERELAANLVRALEPSAFESNTQIGLVGFASEPVVLLPLSHGRSIETVVERILEVEFTGKNTRIADAVELALTQLESRKRADARQFFILITDGHGQEYWNQAQSAGRRLLESGTEVFVGTTSNDYNLPEMLLYAGDESRIFFGPRASLFLPSVAGLLNRCAGSPTYKASLKGSDLSDSKPTKLDTPEKAPKEGFENSLIIKLDTAPLPKVGQSVIVEEHAVPAIEVGNKNVKPGLQAFAFNNDTSASSEEKSETTESSAEVSLSDKEAAQKRADELRKFLESQKGLPSTSDCDTDILFVVERTQRSTFDFVQQLELVSSVVEGISDEDVESGKIRFGLITFSKKPRVLVSLTSNNSRTDFITKLKSVQPYHSVAALDKGVNAAADEIIANRRNDTRVVVVFVASGRIPDESKQSFDNALTSFNKISNVDIFSVSLNPFNDAANLRKLTADKWRVFIDARVRQFGKEVRSSLVSCALAAREGHEVKPDSIEHEPSSEVEKVEHLAIFAKSLQNADPTCGQDPIDLVIILDVSTSVTREFDAQKRVAVDLLKQAATIDVGKRVRVGITTFAEFGRTIISLDNNLSLDELLFALDRIEHIGGQTSAVAGISQSLADVQQHRRIGARLVVVIISDGNSRDGWSRVQKAGNALKKSGADVFAVALSPERSEEELAVYTGSKKRVFGGDKANNFVLASNKVVYGCSVDARERNLADISIAAQESGEIQEIEKLVSKSKPKSEKAGKSQTEFPKTEELVVTGSLPEDVTSPTTEVEKSSSTESATSPSTLPSTESSTKSEITSSKASVSTLSTPSATPSSTHPSKVSSTTPLTFSLTDLTTPEKELHINPLFSDDCTVDLMFIIDTSQSVANEFQKQLQFAVDLVKRLPDDDFEERVNVAAVSFFQTARIEFPFGKLREKSAVLDGLFNVEHTGGSTSAVSGVELAVDEIIRGRRPGARLMVVLISDGNSQDHWDKVLDAAGKLRAVNADVYAVTVSHDYFFRELELYAGNKWFVYIDARIRQFLDEAEMSVVECKNPTVPSNAGKQDTTTIGPQTKLEAIATTLATVSPSTTRTTPIPVPEFLLSGPSCQKDIVDLFIILDTSTSVEKEFYAEKNFALDLIKVLPETDFANRIRISLIKFSDKAALQFGLGDKVTRNDVLYELERVEHTGGQTSLVSGVSLALTEIDKKQRNGSRLVTVIISDGNSQDEWTGVQTTAKKLKHAGSEIYAVTLSEKYFFDELKEYTGNERHVYADERVEAFIQDVGLSVVSCPGRLVDRVTLAPNVEVSATPTTIAIASSTTPPPPPKLQKIETAPEFALARDDSDETHDSGNADAPQSVAKPGKCKYNKMDLIIILDASSSRESVFEHQRELALSLIERLPINKDDTHVATGLNSFTNTPTLRQTLGLGRDKLMVRHAIEDIKYRGGSTLTSKAVELAVKDLERGRRPDALQVVVLMNDGMSQDPWDKVLLSAEKLKATNAERFGVALGDDVDLRELRHYIGRDDRIYRDGSTERFLSDIVALLEGERDCEQPDQTETIEDDAQTRCCCRLRRF